MRLLLVGAGAAVSTVDVERGLRDGLRGLGVDVFDYDLGSRLGLAKRWLERLWIARGKVPAEKPSWADTLYRGSVEALEMALRYQVDFVVVVSAMYLHPDALELMRRAGLRVAIVLTESPYQDAEQTKVAQLADVCWTNERASVAFLRESCRATYYLPAAYDPARHGPDTEHQVDVAAHDVVFVGTGFEERIQLLEQVDWTGIDLGLYGIWGLLRRNSPLRKYVRDGMVDNQITAALYRRATIGLNLYRTSQTYGVGVPHLAVVAESMNPRAYELAACGVFQVADRRAEQTAIFGWSIPTFSSAEELSGLLRRFLIDARAREHCVEVARLRVAPHSFAARAAQVVTDLERSLRGRYQWQSNTRAKTASFT